MTYDKLLWIALWCNLHVATASLHQERHARDAWHEIRRIPPTRVEGDYSIFEHHHVRTNRKTGEYYKLSYKLRRHRNLYVNLDDTSLNVENVSCTADSLRIVVTAEFPLADQLKVWTYPNSAIGRLVYGGSKWGCVASENVSQEDPEPAPIFRNMTAPVFFNRSTRSFVMSTGDASPFSFFGTGYMHYFSNETNPEDNFDDDNSGESFGRRSMAESLQSEGAAVVCPCSLCDYDSDQSRCEAAGCVWTQGIEFGGYCSKSPEGKTRGQYGRFGRYGGEITFNFNYDTFAKSAQTKRITLTEQSNFQAYCDECYAYLKAGMYFEFQTEAFDYFPSYLIYMAAWVEFEATYSFDAFMQATSAVNINPNVESQNFLLNAASGVESNVDFVNEPWTNYNLFGHSSSQRSLIFWRFSIAGIEAQLGIKIPVFMSIQFQTGAAGKASKYSYYYAKEQKGLAYLDSRYSSECTMTHCDELRKQSCNGWCSIQK